MQVEVGGSCRAQAGRTQAGRRCDSLHWRVSRPVGASSHRQGSSRWAGTHSHLLAAVWDLSPPPEEPAVAILTHSLPLREEGAILCITESDGVHVRATCGGRLRAWGVCSK